MPVCIVQQYVIIVLLYACSCDRGKLRVSFPAARIYENVKRIASGQIAVFYEGDEVIGGRIIH